MGLKDLRMFLLILLYTAIIAASYLLFRAIGMHMTGSWFIYGPLLRAMAIIGITIAILQGLILLSSERNEITFLIVGATIFLILVCLIYEYSLSADVFDKNAPNPRRRKPYIIINAIALSLAPLLALLLTNNSFQQSIDTPKIILTDISFKSPIEALLNASENYEIIKDAILYVMAITCFIPLSITSLIFISTLLHLFGFELSVSQLNFGLFRVNLDFKKKK